MPPGHKHTHTQSVFVENSVVCQSQNAYFHLQEIQEIPPLEVTSGFLSQINNNYFSADKETMVLRLQSVGIRLFGFLYTVEM